MCHGWRQSHTDDFDWTRRSGSTSSSRTGPSSGHGGYGEFVVENVIYLMLTWNDIEKMFYCVLLLIFLLLGFYMYIETTPRSYGDKARLLFSPPSSVIGTTSCLKFYYHMYGSAVNRLNVFNGHTIVFTKSGQQGNRWLYAKVTISVQNTVSYVCKIENDIDQGMACLNTILLCP